MTTPKPTVKKPSGSSRRRSSNAVDQRVINPWCGICQSRDFYYEDGVTRFRTMEEAMPALEQGQRDQLASRALINEAQKGAARN